MKETKFKQTEVGMIPWDWKVKELGNEFTIVTGSTPPTNDPKNYGDDFLFVSPMDLGSNKNILSTEKKLSVKGFSVSRPYPEKSVLFTCIGSTIGKCGIASCVLTSNQQINAVFPNEKYSPDYMYYVLLEKGEKIRSLAGCQAVPLINKSEFAATLYQVPPTIEEQQRIANTLSDVDSLISNLEKLMAKKKNIKHGAMQQLLTGRKRLPGFGPSCHPERSTKCAVEGSSHFKMTELGPIPSDWEVKPLKKIGSFSKGAGISRDESNSGNIPAVRYGEIYTKHNDYIKEFYSHISPEIASTSVKLNRGDLLFSASGETKEDIGKTIAFVNDFEAYAGGDIIIVTPTMQINSIYMSYLLNSPSVAKQKALKGQGDAVVHITTDSVKSLIVCLPSKAEQTAIANVLSDMDSEIQTLETKLAKYRKLKTGMMQQLLTGKIRLV